MLASDRLHESTGARDQAPATTASRNPRCRILLLLLPLVILASVAIWTPKELQAVAASTIELLLSTDVSESRTPPGPGPLVGQLDVTSSPSGIGLFVDRELHGVTPQLLVLHTGSHQLTLVSQVGTVSREVRVRPGRRTLGSEAIFPGALVISSEIKREIRVDGTPVVIFDDGELELAQHTQDQSGESRQRREHDAHGRDSARPGDDARHHRSLIGLPASPAASKAEDTMLIKAPTIPIDVIMIRMATHCPGNVVGLISP